MLLRATLVAAALLLLGLPTAAVARYDAPPRLVTVEAPGTATAGTEMKVSFKGRDRDGVIRGYELDFGDGGMTAISACSPRKPRRGRIAQFSVPYTYLAPGTYAIKVRVLSGGCDEPQQRSKVRTRTVVVSPAVPAGFTPVG
jgi:hypothetical protein